MHLKRRVLLVILFIVNIGINTPSSHAMEEIEKEPQELLPRLPPEITLPILNFATNEKGKDAQHPIFKLGNNYYFFKPIARETCYLRMKNPHAHESYSVSRNMNRLHILLGTGMNLFSQQCWLGKNVYHGNNFYRIDDDITMQRYLRNEKKEIESHHFDGINDNNLFLIMAHGKKFSRFYIGKIDQRHNQYYDNNSRNYRTHVPLNDDNQPFDYVSNNYRGQISAFALCKTINRCAIVDEHKKVEVYTIVSNDNDDESMQVSLSSSRNTPAHLKQISFITPNTLLALSNKGKLFIVAADAGQPIQFYKQRIKTHGSKKLNFINIAIDACHPYQILMHTRDNHLIFWDIKHKILIPLIQPKEQIQDIWFYDDAFGCLDLPRKDVGDETITGWSTNFTKYRLKLFSPENIASNLLEEYSSQTTVTPFEKKSKKSFIKKHFNEKLLKPLGISASLVAGSLAAYYALKKLELSDSFFNYPLIIGSGIVTALGGNYLINRLLSKN